MVLALSCRGGGSPPDLTKKVKEALLLSLSEGTGGNRVSVSFEGARSQEQPGESWGGGPSRKRTGISHGTSPARHPRPAR